MSDRHRRDDRRRHDERHGRDRSRSPHRHRDDYDRRDKEGRDERRYDDERRYRHHDDGRTDEKLRRLEERRKQDELDAEYEWGGKSANTTAAGKEPIRGSKVEQLEEKHASFTRYQDDARLNAHQKGTARWDDPARHFVDDLKPKVQKHRVQPNRFGIEPGGAWDGVDRSNGFEVRYFMAKARAGLQKDLEHQYGVQNY